MSDAQAETPEELSPGRKRLTDALEKFNKLNAGNGRYGLPPMQIPPYIETIAGYNALVALLVELGVVEEEALIERKAEEFATIITQIVDVGKQAQSHALITGGVNGGAPR